MAMSGKGSVFKENIVHMKRLWVWKMLWEFQRGQCVWGRVNETIYKMKLERYWGRSQIVQYLRDHS